MGKGCCFPVKAPLYMAFKEEAVMQVESRRNFAFKQTL